MNLPQSSVYRDTVRFSVCSLSAIRGSEETQQIQQRRGSDGGAPVRSYGLSQDLPAVWEYLAERCVRPCHIKCECFPLSNLITDFYGGISRRAERQSKKDGNWTFFSFRVIYGTGGIITEWGNSLWMSEMVMLTDGF